MKLIIGLGNPGKKYENTRHNVGFMVADILAKNWHCQFRLEKKFNSEIFEVNLKGQKIKILKPQTFMNDSGGAVSKIVSYYRIKPKDIIMITDDIELPLGKIRVRLSGSSGGHKGIQSIIDSLGTEQIPRVRVGIGLAKTIENRKTFENLSNQPTLDTKEYVLENFTKRELPEIRKAIAAVLEIIIESLSRCDYLKAHTLDIY